MSGIGTQCDGLGATFSEGKDCGICIMVDAFDFPLDGSAVTGENGNLFTTVIAFGADETSKNCMAHI